MSRPVPNPTTESWFLNNMFWIFSKECFCDHQCCLLLGWVFINVKMSFTGRDILKRFSQEKEFTRCQNYDKCVSANKYWSNDDTTNLLANNARTDRKCTSRPQEVVFRYHFTFSTFATPFNFIFRLKKKKRFHALRRRHIAIYDSLKK